MTPRQLEEYRALRETIRERGTARIWVVLAGLTSWAGLAIATTALAVLPIATFLPLLVLAATFEIVFSLHTGVERVGRYIQVFFEDETIGGWEHEAMAYGRAFPGSGPDPLFGFYFWLATRVQLHPRGAGAASAARMDGGGNGPRVTHRPRGSGATAGGPPAGHRPRTIRTPEGLDYRASVIVTSSACCAPRQASVVSKDSVRACASLPSPPPPIVTAGMPEAHRQIRVGRPFRQWNGQAQRPARVAHRLNDRRVVRQRPGRAIADEGLLDRHHAGPAPPAILFDHGFVDRPVKIARRAP